MYAFWDVKTTSTCISIIKCKSCFCNDKMKIQIMQSNLIHYFMFIFILRVLLKLIIDFFRVYLLQKYNTFNVLWGVEKMLLDDFWFNSIFQRYQWKILVVQLKYYINDDKNDIPDIFTSNRIPIIFHVHKNIIPSPTLWIVIFWIMSYTLTLFLQLQPYYKQMWKIF